MKEQSVQSLDRTLDIIELLATSPQGMGVTEIGLQLQLHKSTVHRLVTALARRGYIEKDQKTGLYQIGLKFIEISSHHLHQLELKTEAAPLMRHLAEMTGQITHLAILDETDVVYIEKVDVVQSLRLYSHIGRRIPVYCSALGKVLLSGQDVSRQKQTIQSIIFTPFTENTVQDPEIFFSELQRTTQRGWAVDNEEHESGIRCIAAPVKDFTRKVIAAISVSGERNTMTAEKDENLITLVTETAHAISKKMGFN
ncbi:MAG: IclR family transcriptional regulator [Thermoclostridium sp.]|nr:IclR family transcriptional regulator [Thermoclostridium sp.]